MTGNYTRTTRRERLENRIAKREEWAQAAERRAADHDRAVGALVGDWPFGQPCHTQSDVNRHRRAINHAGKAWEETQKADYHRRKAEGLADQLETTIFSDDADAAEKIQAKIERIRAEVEWIKAFNKQSRKEKWDAHAAFNHYRENPPRGLASGVRSPSLFIETCGVYQGYELSNRNQEIHRLEARLKDVQKRQERQAAADDAGGLMITTNGRGWTVITFSEKPPRDVLNALKAAGFRWRGGSWQGAGEVPEAVKALQD